MVCAHEMWTCVQAALHVWTHMCMPGWAFASCAGCPPLCLSARLSPGHTALLPSLQGAGVAHVMAGREPHGTTRTGVALPHSPGETARLINYKVPP